MAKYFLLVKRFLGNDDYQSLITKELGIFLEKEIMTQWSVGSLVAV